MKDLEHPQDQVVGYLPLAPPYCLTHAHHAALLLCLDSGNSLQRALGPSSCFELPLNVAAVVGCLVCNFAAGAAGAHLWPAVGGAETSQELELKCYRAGIVYKRDLRVCTSLSQHSVCMWQSALEVHAKRNKSCWSTCERCDQTMDGDSTWCSNCMHHIRQGTSGRFSVPQGLQFCVHYFCLRQYGLCISQNASHQQQL